MSEPKTETAWQVAWREEISRYIPTAPGYGWAVIPREALRNFCERMNIRVAAGSGPTGPSTGEVK